MTPSLQNAITDILGILVGHAQDFEAITGCTVVLCPEGAVAGVDQRGGGPGTRETDLLNPVNNVEKIHAVMLAGGSAFGLDAAGGAVRWLEENDYGYEVGVAKVPLVPAAILFDLPIGKPDVRPDAEMGYQACLNASDQPPAQGSVGAGTGATVGKLMGFDHATKGGIGTASIELEGGIKIGAIMAVNPVGEVVDPSNGEILAGVRNLEEGGFIPALEVIRDTGDKHLMNKAIKSNTVIGVVATNARLTKAQAAKVAQMGQAGVTRTIRPAHTQHDGDTLFALATGEVEANVSLVGAFAAEVVAQATLNAVKNAKGMGGVPGIGEL